MGSKTFNSSAFQEVNLSYLLNFVSDLKLRAGLLIFHYTAESTCRFFKLKSRVLAVRETRKVLNSGVTLTCMRTPHIENEVSALKKKRETEVDAKGMHIGSTID
jgi:hypothetical protein